MKLTTRSEYALLAILNIARSEEKSCVSLSQIANQQKLPIKYMEHLMQTMRKAGCLVSTKGKRGGYCLARPAKKIAIAEIVRLFDGALAPMDSVSKYFYRSTPLEREKKVVRLMKKIRNYIANTLEKTTLADIM